MRIEEQPDIDRHNPELAVRVEPGGCFPLRFAGEFVAGRVAPVGAWDEVLARPEALLEHCYVLYGRLPDSREERGLWHVHVAGGPPFWKWEDAASLDCRGWEGALLLEPTTDSAFGHMTLIRLIAALSAGLSRREGWLVTPIAPRSPGLSDQDADLLNGAPGEVEAMLLVIGGALPFGGFSRDSLRSSEAGQVSRQKPETAQPPEAATYKRLRTVHNVSVADLVDAEFLTPGEKLMVRVSGREAGGIVDVGGIAVNGTVHPTPTRAMIEALQTVGLEKAHGNGWDLWRVPEGTRSFGSAVSLADIRSRYENSNSV